MQLANAFMIHSYFLGVFYFIERFFRKWTTKRTMKRRGVIGRLLARLVDVCTL